MLINIAICFTIVRFLLSPIVAINILKSNWFFSIITFLIASFTDIADGYFARILNQETKIGSILDPLADKFFLISCYISLLFSTFKFNLLPLWFIYTILFKEALLILGALIILNLEKNFLKVKPSILGKLNTFFQIIFILFIFFLNYFNKVVCIDIFLYFITLVNLVTLVHYYFKNFYKL